MRLNREDRRGNAVRILQNQKILEDLYDHSLIQSSLDESGKNLVWEQEAQTSRCLKSAVLGLEARELPQNF